LWFSLKYIFCLEIDVLYLHLHPSPKFDSILHVNLAAKEELTQGKSLLWLGIGVLYLHFASVTEIREQTMGYDVKEEAERFLRHLIRNNPPIGVGA
jgi:hypothetical protein